MFDVFAKPGLPSSPIDMHTSLPSWCLNSAMMTDSRNFLDTKILSWGRPDEEGSSNQERTCTSDVEDEDGLELGLSLSLGGSLCKPRRGDVGKPSSLCAKVQKERSGNFGLVLEESLPSMRVKPEVEVGGTHQPLSTEASNIACPQISQNSAYGWKQENRKIEDSAQQTAAQIWQALQKNGSVPVLPPSNTEGATAFQELKEAAAAVWARRTASLQMMDVLREGNDSAPQCLRRSSGNVVNMMSQQLVDCAPAPLSRQVSSVESLQDKNPDIALGLQQHEALELQRKKELQAQRRQEARKRRKSLIEEKQQKKARKEDPRVLTQTRSSPTNTSHSKSSCASVTTQDASCPPNGQNVGLQRAGSKQWVQSKEISFPASVASSEYDKEHISASDQFEGRQKPSDFRRNTKQEMEKSSMGRGKAFDKNGPSERSMMEVDVLQRSNSRMETTPLSSGFEAGKNWGVAVEHAKHNARPRAAKASMNLQQQLQMACAASSRGNPDVDGAQEMAGDGRDWKTFKMEEEGEGARACQSSSSEPEEEQSSSVQNDSGDVEALSRKAASESSHCHGVADAPLLPPMVMSSNPLSFPPAFPVLPIPYPFPMPGAGASVMPLQLGFSVPYFMQYPTPSSAVGGENPHPTAASQLPSAFQVPVSSGLSPYHLPIPDGPFPWFPIAPTAPAGGAHQPSGPALLPTGDEHDNNCSEGKCSRDAESQSPASEPPVAVLQPQQRTSSLSNSKNEAAQFAPLSKQLDSQATVSNPKLGLARTAPRDKSSRRGRSKDRPAASRTVVTEGHQSLPLAAQALSQDTGRMPHFLEDEGHMAISKGRESGNDKVPKDSKSRFKQEEGSTESQSPSEGLSQEACNLQPVKIDGQKGGSLPDLPWVSTTGVGPNGKTISGVMYISNRRQARLVCSCHGTHMSPTEFVQHAGSIDLSNPERHIVVNPFPFLSQLATAPV